MEPERMPKGSNVCVICHQELKEGGAAMVRDDAIINSIRRIKKIFNTSQNNVLFVCQKDLETHTKKRKKFEKELLLISAFAVIIMLLLTGLPLLGGRFELGVFLSSLFIATLIILFAIVFKYTPAIAEVQEIGNPTPRAVAGSKLKEKPAAGKGYGAKVHKLKNKKGDENAGYNTATTG